MIHTVAKFHDIGENVHKMLGTWLFRMYTQLDCVTSVIARLVWLIKPIILYYCSFLKTHPKEKFLASKTNDDVKSDAEELKKLESF